LVTRSEAEQKTCLIARSIQLLESLRRPAASTLEPAAMSIGLQGVRTPWTPRILAMPSSRLIVEDKIKDSFLEVMRQ
jgi:hypothetical protein